jgi:hypothetical protein
MVNEETVLTFVSLTAARAIAIHKVDLNSGALTGRESAPLDFLVFEGELPRVVGYTDDWEIFFVGRNTRFTVAGETFSFPNPVGYIVGALQNRVTNLMSAPVPLGTVAIADEIGENV